MIPPSPPPPDRNQRPILVHFAPLPPLRNGIADYAATLLLRLSQHYECICVVEAPEAVSPEIWQSCHVISHEHYARIADSLRQERHLAHLGNNPDHVPILEALARRPGVVVLHDLTLHYLLECWSRETHGGIRALEEAIWALHGSMGRHLASVRLNERMPLQSGYAELPALGLLKQIASGVITHSQHGRVLARARGYDGPLHVAPHFAHLPDPDSCAERSRAFRRRHGIGAETVVLASLGFINPNKLIPQVLRCLAALPAALDDWCYVIGGENRDPRVAEALQQHLGTGRVLLLDYLEEEAFDEVLCAADLVVNLRVPTSGETSGTVCRALAHGVPCIVNRHGWYAELPETATWQLDPERGAIAADLRLALIEAIASPAARRAKGAAARAYAQSRLVLETAVEVYRTAIETAHASEEARAPGEGAPAVLGVDRTLQFPGHRGFSTLLAPPQDPVLHLLRGEIASLAPEEAPPHPRPSAAPAAPPRRILIPAVGPDISALFGAQTISAGAEAPPQEGSEADQTGSATEGAAPPPFTQAFAAVDLQFGIGGIALAAADAAVSLTEGDLFTLLLRAHHPFSHLASPDDTPLSPPGGPRALPEAEGWADRMEQVLAAAGFRSLRQSRADLPPNSPEDGYCELHLITAVLIAKPGGPFGCFLPVL